jgi:hypothetical protein
VRSTEEDNLSIEADRDFDLFFQLTEPRLRRALMAAYEFETGREATAEALAWAWEGCLVRVEKQHGEFAAELSPAGRASRARTSPAWV